MEQIYFWLQIGIAAATLLGIAHSIYRGTIGEMIENIRRIRHVESQVDQIEDKQEDMADAIVLLGHAQTGDGIEPDTAALEEDLRDMDKGPARYARTGFYRGETEDEEEGIGPEVREP